MSKENELLWKQYESQIGLYKFYIEIVIKLNAFHYAITGAILTFYFANRGIPDIKWALLLPAFLSFCLAAFFAYGAERNLVSRRDVFNLRDLLKLSVVPELMVLTVLLVIFCVAHFLTCVSIVYIIYNHCT
jgi:uncharacterized membrane protein YbhN (UPF0104 family)